MKFDNLDVVKQIGRCIARFLLVKYMYVRRQQFPLCLAYAVTIHKLQGLSLHAAVINIGFKVFKEGMAYVALSDVRALSGLFLVEFDESKVNADSSCVRELNRLRSLHAPHLRL